MRAIIMCIISFFIGFSIQEQVRQKTKTKTQAEFRQTLFTKGYIFTQQIDSTRALQQSIFWTFNGDYNTLNIPLILKTLVDDRLSLSRGLQITNITNSNSIELPVNEFGSLDISAYMGGNYNFDNTTDGYFSLQLQLHKFETDANTFTPAIQTSPINYNFGIKF
ncbi:hypothetical protein [Psychroserpens sp.]|uniref:hypothetical protein n=1 Tax=Psychroserpens sp. TaxID=2020870 RepID=UPI003C773EE1